MKSSIRTQIMTAFIVILTLTMVLCIGLNNGLLKDFYYQKKQEKVVHYYEKLDQLTNNKSENDSKVSAVLISMRDADNISFIQTTSDWSLDEVSANCVSNMRGERTSSSSYAVYFGMGPHGHSHNIKASGTI